MSPFTRAIRTLMMASAGCAAAERPQIGPMVAYPATAASALGDVPYANGSFSCGPSQSGTSCGSFDAGGRRPILGISAFIPLTDRLALRAAPAYQRIRLDRESIVPVPPPGTVASSTLAISGNRWELPLAAMWKLSKYVNVGAGPAVSIATGAKPPRLLSRRTIAGVAAGVEFPFRTRFATVAPQVEYTRWFSRHYGIVWPRNRVTIGVAIRF